MCICPEIVGVVVRSWNIIAGQVVSVQLFRVLQSANVHLSSYSGCCSQLMCVRPAIPGAVVS